MFASIALVIVLFAQGTIPRDSLRLILTILIFGLMFGMVIFLFIIYGAGQRRGAQRVEMAAVTTVTCSSCGAPNKLQPGQVLEQCIYCGAAMLPSATAMNAGLAAVNQARRQAQIERFRAERSAMLNASSANATALVPYLVGGSLAFVILPWPFIMAYKMVVGTMAFHPGILIAFGVLGLLAAGAVWLYKVMQRRKQRWRATVTALANGMQGAESRLLGDVVGWLNTYWAGPYTTTYLMVSPLISSVAATIDGYAALLYIDPKQPAEHYPPKVHAFLAAWVPGVSDEAQFPGRTAEVESIVQWMKSQGFVVEYNQGGLLAMADEDIMTAIRKQPEVMFTLSQVTVSLARLARGLGASPVAPIP